MHTPADDITDPPALEAAALACIRHDRTLFGNLSFTVNPGLIVQIEGANGSGKTSLLRMLCGLLTPESGMVRWRGNDIERCRAEYTAELAYIGHAPGIKAELTPRENLRMMLSLSRARDGADVEAALERVGLYGFEDLPSRALSAGQRRRVALARLLIIEAALWILDEPFTALDKTGRELIETLLAEHSARGGMAVLTTHHVMNLSHCPTRSVRLSA
jgi:heme exporter protein A